MMRFILLILLGFGFSAALYQGTKGTAMGDVSVNRSALNQSASQQRSSEIAKNDTRITPEKERPGRLPEQKPSAPRPVDPETPKRTNAGPQKEFVPTEKIEADQAVDFPSDI